MTGPEPRRAPLRVVLVDDSALFRRGVAALLERAGVDVVGELSSPEALMALVTSTRPDAVILDVRMPPTHTDEGVRVALQLHTAQPPVAALVLSTYVETRWARDLFSSGSHGLGYLLKDRVDDVGSLVEALRRIAAGGTVMDPEVVVHLMETGGQTSAVSRLTERERAVLKLMAEGRSNRGIGEALFLSPRTIETHIAAIFEKLPLDSDDKALNRRVLAVLTYLDDHP